MSRIVIIGLSNNRLEIISHMGREHDIVAYSDIKRLSKGYLLFDYCPYIYIENINSINFDYIVITYPKEIYNEVINELLDANIDLNKVVYYDLFKNTLCVDVIYNFAKNAQEYNTALFGMSHSQCGIQLQYLKKHEKIYKFSAPSMDLFCHYHILLELFREHYQKSRSVEQFVFELPYYIFNFDLSRFKSFVLNRIYYFYRVNNYHNMSEAIDESIIKSFERYTKIFQTDSKSTRFSYNEEYIKKTSISLLERIKFYYHKISSAINMVFLHDDVWEKDFVDTKKENIIIWSDILELIHKINPNAKVKVVVFPFSPLFVYTHKNSITKRKTEFYEILNLVSPEVDVIDEFDTGNKYKFLDHCHLDYCSREEYSRHFDEII